MTAVGFDLMPVVGPRTRYARMRVERLTPLEIRGYVEVSKYPHGPWRPAGARLARKLAPRLAFTVNGVPVEPVLPLPAKRRKVAP